MVIRNGNSLSVFAPVLIFHPLRSFCSGACYPSLIDIQSTHFRLLLWVISLSLNRRKLLARLRPPVSQKDLSRSMSQAVYKRFCRFTNLSPFTLRFELLLQRRSTEPTSTMSYQALPSFTTFTTQNITVATTKSFDVVIATLDTIIERNGEKPWGRVRRQALTLVEFERVRKLSHVPTLSHAKRFSRCRAVA